MTWVPPTSTCGLVAAHGTAATELVWRLRSDLYSREERAHRVGEEVACEEVACEAHVFSIKFHMQTATHKGCHTAFSLLYPIHLYLGGLAATELVWRLRSDLYSREERAHTDSHKGRGGGCL